MGVLARAIGVWRRKGKELGPREAMALLSVAALVYTVVFGALSITRYNTFHASTFDLGIMSQVVWNISRGRWFETSIDRATNSTLIGNYLGNHVRPLLLLLAPLYRLWPDPRSLLVVQAVALGAAAFPLYQIARRRIGNKPALVVACGYLAYPALGFLNLVDFHPMALTIPLLFLAYWALGERRWGLFWTAVLLALAAKEEMVVPIGAWGLVNFFRRDRRRVGLGLMALAGVWSILCFGLIIPYFNEGQSYRFFRLWSHLPGFADQPAAQGGTAQPMPPASWQTVALFLIHLALPLGFLPILGFDVFAVALPSLVYLLAARQPAFHSIGYQYPAVLIPWFFLAVVEGLSRARRLTGRFGRQRLYRLGIAFFAAGTVGINVAVNPIILYAQAGVFQRDPYYDQIVEAMALIPPNAGVATVNRFGASLANRRILVPIEYPPPLRLDHVQMADYVLLDLVDCRLMPAVDPRSGYAELVAQVLDTDLYRIRYWSGRILLLERGATSEEEKAAVLEYVTGLVEERRPCWP